MARHPRKIGASLANGDVPGADFKYLEEWDHEGHPLPPKRGRVRPLEGPLGL